MRACMGGSDKMKTYLPFALAILVPMNLVADTGADTEETVQVTATRTAMSVADAVAPVVVIDGDEIRRSTGFDLAEVLRLHAGIEIGRTGGPGQSASLFIRGTNSNHTQVLVDGVRINPGTLGGAAIHNLRPAEIERIEIVKGPRSALYGTEAIGGVINIITRRTQRPLEGEFRVGFGNYGTREVAASISGRGDTLYGAISLDLLNTDGFPTRRGSDIDRGHDNRTVHFHVGRETERATLELRHWQARGNTEYLDFFLSPVDQDFRNESTTIEFASSLANQLSMTVRLADTVDEIEQNQSLDFARTRRRSLDLQLDHADESPHRYTGGLLFTRERTDAEIFGTGFSERPDTQAAFGQYQYGGDALDALVSARIGRHDAYGSHTTWNAELGRDMYGGWRVTAGAGTAFRAPDSTQRFGFGGNPALEPERARSMEVGIRGPIGAHGRLEWQVYQMHISDLVTYDVGANQLDNIDRARIRGIEITGQLQLGSWQLRQGLVFQDPVDASNGEPLPRRARRSAQTAVVFTASDTVTLSADLLVTGKRRDSAFSPDMMGGYTLLNLATSWRASPRLTVDARVENLLGRDYETALGFPQADRSAQLRVRWRFGVAD
jgi:vitamin B12 transporter